MKEKDRGSELLKKKKLTNQEKKYSWKLKSEGEERELKNESFWVFHKEAAIGEDLRVNGAISVVASVVW